VLRLTNWLNRCLTSFGGIGALARNSRSGLPANSLLSNFQSDGRPKIADIFLTTVTNGPLSSVGELPSATSLADY